MSKTDKRKIIETLGAGVEKPVLKVNYENGELKVKEGFDLPNLLPIRKSKRY